MIFLKAISRILNNFSFVQQNFKKRRRIKSLIYNLEINIHNLLINLAFRFKYKILNLIFKIKI